VSISAESLSAALFPHDARDIRVCETHLSFVVLTGEFAYKIKKAVRLDFIDATALARRRELCEAELRLNRRYAPELYLQVVPIVVRDERLSFGANGDAVDYAVQMRQFDAGDELRALLARDAVDTDDFAVLADLVAEFHASAAVLDRTPPAGSAAFDRKARENTTSVLRRARLIDAEQEAAALERWTMARLASQRSQLEGRERQGAIRECHGDLHTGNVVRWRGRLLPFDCIEFDTELRYIDVLNEIAFLTMDLIDRARTDLAFVFLNRYLERTGDYAGMPLLSDYLVYRALVRTKVELISLEQHPQSDDTRGRALSLIRTASRCSRPATSTLIVMHGPSGSGKSWLSERLVPRLPAVRIRSDLERKRLAGLDPFERPSTEPDQGIYTIEFNERTYDHLLGCARSCLRAGINAIIDAAFLKAHERHAFAELAREERTRFFILSCSADATALAARIAQRRAARSDPSDADERVMERQLETMEPIAPDERDQTLFVNTQEPEALTKVLQRCGAIG
jgi:uncharacterized protein